jgi:putative hydrolase of the HAD superfamily
MLVNNLYKYQWLIFDADNTLFDYDEAEKYALLKTLGDFDIPYDKQSIIETYHKINHKIWMQFEQGLIKSQHEIKIKRTRQLFEVLNADKKVQTFADDYLFNLSQNRQLLNNALKIIKILSKKHQLALMTNGMTSVQKPRFAASPISQYFKHTIISEEIKHSKPSKEIFDHAFELMKQPQKENVLMIGDNLGSDIQGGINYNIDTAWYNPKKHQTKHLATYEIHDLLEFIIN